MNQQLKRALLTRGYRTNKVLGAESELYDIYEIKTGQLVASLPELKAWQWLAGEEETQP